MCHILGVAPSGGVHPCAGYYLPKVVLWCECLGWGGPFSSVAPPHCSRFVHHAAILTLGLLLMTSGPKALAVCGWLLASHGDSLCPGPVYPVPDDIWEAGFIAHRLHVLGINQRVSALDIARHEATAF